MTDTVDETVKTLARRASVVHDTATIAGRAIRALPREPEMIVPAIVVPVFFFAVNVGALQAATEAAGLVPNYKAFQLPVAIIFAVTGISRASALVTDIQGGYFDRLLVTPIRRLPLLFGLMVADFVLVMALSVPVLVLGLLLGVDFEAGLAGMVLFVLLGAAWGLAFTGFPYAIALKTGNPGAVNASFILFFPFAFLTSTYLPTDDLTGWLATVAVYNPVTYLLGGMRSLIFVGWDWSELGAAVLAIVLVGAASMTLALLALRGRVARE